MIRVGSAETQDCVSTSSTAGQLGQDMEELRFIPSVVSEPLWAKRARHRPIRLRPAGLSELGQYDLGQIRRLRPIRLWVSGFIRLGQKQKSHRDVVRLWAQKKEEHNKNERKQDTEKKNKTENSPMQRKKKNNRCGTKKEYIVRGNRRAAPEALHQDVLHQLLSIC